MCGCGKTEAKKGGVTQRIMVPTGKDCPEGYHRARWWERHGDERVQVAAPFCDKVESKMAGMRGLVVEMRRVRGQISEAVALRDLTGAEVEKFASLPKVKRIAVENFLSSLKGMSQYEAEMNLAMDAKSYKWSRETVKAIKDGIKLAARSVASEATEHERCPDGSHWNDDKNKCVKLTKDLAKMSKEAHYGSAVAKTKDEHGMARLGHEKAAFHLNKAGFRSLAKKHDSFASEHETATAGSRIPSVRHADEK